jgi:hypothetical protein
MFEFFARLNANGFRTQDDEADHLTLHFEKGRLGSVRFYKYDERCNMLDSLNIFSEADRYFLVKQCPWRKFELNSIRVDDYRWISRSADEEFVFNLQVQPVIYETVKRLVDISAPPA